MKKLLVKAEFIVTPYSPVIEASEGVEAQPEVQEVKEWRVIAQTQGSDEELAIWLAGDAHKYPEGYQVEYIDITAQVEQERINAESLKYLADTDWIVLRHLRQKTLNIPFSLSEEEYLKAENLRAQAASRILK